MRFLNATTQRILTGLLIGAAGGGMFAVAGLPAPWIAGSMIAGVVAVYWGIRFEVPLWLRNIAFVLLGIQVGGSISWDTLARAGQWPLSILLLAVTVVAVTFGCAMYFRRFHKWDVQTSLFASLPGALSLTLVFADEAKSDMRKVTISQCIRLFFLVAALPAAISMMSPPNAQFASQPSTGIVALIPLIAVAAATGIVFEWLKVPAGLILGAIVASALLYLSGLVDGSTPDIVLIPANIILGVMIAARFQGLPLGDVKELFRESFVGFLLALAISAIGAGLASYFGDLSLPLTLLAFAPGGLEAMTIMAFALNLDPAYVAAHQVARYVGICLFMPPIAAYLIGFSKSKRAVSNVEDA